MDFLQLALQATIKDIFDSFKDTTEDFHLNEKGENLILIPKTKVNLRDKMIEMAKDNENIKSIGFVSYDAEKYSSYISDDVKIIKNIELKKILEIQEKLFNSEEFMGIIIYDPDTKMTLNISHFLVLLQLLLDEKFYGKMSNKKFDIFIFKKNADSELANVEKNINSIYSSKERNMIDEIQQKWLTEIIRISAIGINLMKDVKLHSEIKDYEIENFHSISEETNPFEINTVLDISIQTKIYDYNIIVPLHTLVSRGEFIPYFGVAPIIPDRGDIKGLNLYFTGFLTGNILNRLDITTSVCTGSYDNRTLTGLMTLSKINANSMYFDNILNSTFSLWLAKAKKVAKDLNQKILKLK